MLKNTRFKLIFKQLYLADESKIKKINPKIDVPIIATDNIASKEQANLSTRLNTYKLRLQPAPLVKQEPESNSIINTITDNTDFGVIFDKMQSCTLCDLCNSRQNVIIERGNRAARVMIVGDYPTHDDDNYGYPFAAANGELLDKMIQAMQLDVTKDVYITNLIKCKPKANLEPTQTQINLCKNYLFSQIKHVKPIVIIALGRFAGQVLLNNSLSIKDMRNKINYYNDIPVIVSYSVETIKRASVDVKYFEYKKATWEDLQLAMQIIGKR